MGIEQRDGASRTAENGAPSSADDRDLAEALSSFLESTGGAVSRLADVYGDRLRASTKETSRKFGIAAVAGVALVLWIGSATLAAVRGLCGAIASISGGEVWLGDLVGGLLALGLAAGALAAATRWSDRKQLQALEIKYGQHDTNTAGADAATVPRSSAGVGEAPAANGAASAR